ncbi:MAG TPA: PAS domain S-box protein [Methanomassiliicoccales archaeon]|nr:PAS domain S-box protein [Methanomassiliicoccales archaeon]
MDRIIAEHTGDWIAVLDQDDKVIYSTPSVQRVIGHASAELKGHDFCELVHPDDVSSISEKMGRCSGDDIPLFEYRFKHRDGNYVHLESKVKMFNVGDGQSGRIIMVNRDITQRRAAAGPLVDIGPSGQQHLSGSDDLKKLLTIQEFIEREKEKLTDVQSIVRFDQMGVMTTELIENLNFAMELQAIGKGTPKWQSLQRVIHNVVESIDPGMLHIQVLAMRLEVRADPLLKRAFHHLIDNTIKHSGNAHKIWILYEMEADGIKIIYEDNGLGISDDMKAHIFEDTGGGRHGLFLVKRILDSTGISIVETGKRGQGVRFEMFVPKGQCRIN